MAESGPLVSGTMESSDNSDWMSRLPVKLQRFSLWNLAIPGSHDTMGYDLDMDSHLVEPDSLVHLSKMHCVRSLVHKWATTQEVDIFRQLDAGVRYFDLRVARKPDEPDPTRLHFYHGLYTRSDVQTVLRRFNDWAGAHPTEVLVLALSHFKGMEEDVHRRLVDFISTLFDARLVHAVDHPTLKFCWESGRSVIISYDHPVAGRHPKMWRRIPYFYGDTVVSSQVVAALEDKLRTRRPPSYFFVCGLNLTLPEGVCALRHTSKTLKSVTLRGLPTLLDWVKAQDLRARDPPRVNIIAADFVNQLDFVSAVIKLNHKLF